MRIGRRKSEQKSGPAISLGPAASRDPASVAPEPRHLDIRESETSERGRLPAPGVWSTAPRTGVAIHPLPYRQGPHAPGNERSRGRPLPRADRTDTRWAPIAIGVPIPPFAWRPPSLDGDVYQADTVCDGWSTPDLVVRLASVRGYIHRHKGIPRQDEAVVTIHQPTGTVVFAVADGVSNSPLSHVGASIACRAAVRSVLGDLDDSHLVSWSDALRAAASRMTTYVADLRREPVDADTVGRLMATTLVLGIARPGAHGVTATMVQVGDTGAWLLSRGRFVPVLMEKTDAAASVVPSAVFALPRMPAQITPMHIEIPPDAALLVGTDGFGDPLDDGMGEVGYVFAHALAVPPPPLGLAHLLDFSRETFDDDRTLLAIWPMRGR